MKKLLTTLFLCVLLSLCAILVACPAPQGVSAQSVQADPVGALNSALEKAGGDFAADETGVMEIIASALEKGSVGVSADLSQLIGGNCEFDLVSYIDLPAKRMQYDLDMRLPGSSPLQDIRFYMDPNGMTVHAPQLLGYDGALRLDIDSLSAFGDQLPEGMIDSLKASMASIFEGTPANTKQSLTEIFTELGYEVTETTYEGEEIVQLTLNITSDKLAALLCDLIEDSDFDADTKAEAKAGLQEAFSELELSAKVEFHILKANGALIDAIVTGSFAMDTPDDPSAPDAMEFTLGYKASNTQISIFADLASVEDGYKSEAGRIELNVDKTVEGSKLIYTTKLDLTMSDVTMHVGSVTFDYDKSTSDYNLTLKVGDFLLAPSEGAAPSSDALLRLSGKIQKADKRVTLTVDEFAMQNFGPTDATLPLDITIYFEKGTMMPEVPSNPKDIMTLTEAEIAAIEAYMSTLFPSYE